MRDENDLYSRTNFIGDPWGIAALCPSHPYVLGDPIEHRSLSRYNSSRGHHSRHS